MDEKIKNLWNNNKIVFFLLIPLIALYFARNAIISLLVSSGNRIESDTSKTSEALKSQQDANDAKADQIIKDADQAASVKPTVNENWDKK